MGNFFRAFAFRLGGTGHRVLSPGIEMLLFLDAALALFLLLLVWIGTAYKQ